MRKIKCPTCGREAVADSSCHDCGHANGNGVSKPGRVKPPPPPEAAHWVIEPVPPELAEDFRRTFNEAAFVADLEESLGTGGADIDALIARIERKANGRN